MNSSISANTPPPIQAAMGRPNGSRGINAQIGMAEGDAEGRQRLVLDNPVPVLRLRLAHQRRRVRQPGR